MNVRGVVRTSLSEIAARLGVSRNALYYYVSSREDLLFQCYRRAAQITATRLAASISVAANAAEALRDFITRMLDQNGPEIANRTEIAMLNELQRAEIQTLHAALIAKLAGLIEAGQRDGMFRACDPEINARIALSVISWTPMGRRWGQSVAFSGADRLLQAAISTLLDGWAPHAARTEFTPLDLTKLTPRSRNAFDRDAASAAKREMVLQTASRLFNRKGIDSTSLEEIAAQVGATKRTLYHHLGNKRALVLACYERAFRIFFFIIDRMNEYTGPRAQALVAAVHAAALVYPNEELTPLSLLAGYATLTPSSRARINEHVLRLAEQYRVAIRVGIAEGSIGEVDVDSRAMVLAGVTSWLVREDVPPDAGARSRIAQEIADLIAAGLTPRTSKLAS